MRRLFCILFLLQSPLYAGQLVICPTPEVPMSQRVTWAFQHTDAKTFWVGYSITRLMDPDQIFISNVSFHGNMSFDGHKQSLREWIYGVKTDRRTALSAAAQSELDRLEHKKQEKIWKEVAVFQRFHHGSSIPDTTCVIDMSLHYGLNEPLFWIGKVSDEESFQYLSNEYGHLLQEPKRQLIGAISIHSPALAFPFLKQLLTGNEPEEVQQAAASFAAELDTPEALALLQNVAKTNRWKEVRQSALAGISDMESVESIHVLSQFAFSNPDRELRQTAMAMLADKEDPQALQTLERIAWFDPDSDIRQNAIAMMSESEKAVPILLKIANDHPSKETREAAIRMLAETVAGREVLKKKLER